jgi:hypothetical protein
MALPIAWLALLPGFFALFFALLKHQDCKPPGRSGSPHRYRSQGHGSGLSPSFLIIADPTWLGCLVQLGGLRAVGFDD